jgi:hypothetical protein
MAILLQIGIAYPSELSGGIGHVACTLGGINYECRGSRGCLKGSAARGATNKLFRHHFYQRLTDAQAKEAKAYADSCIRQPYVWDRVPTSHHGGDCSGFISGIICAATGKHLERLFSTGTWTAVDAHLGFHSGLGGGVTPGASAIGVQDRPYPGYPITEKTDKPGHIKWIQARLNYAARNKHPVLSGAALHIDGGFGPLTEKVVIAFQKSHGLQGLGMVGPKTWTKLNNIR